MIAPFSTNTLLSFYAWLDHRLLQNGGMFTNTVSQLHKQPTDSVLGSSVDAYAAPFRSLVWDQSISGANQFGSVSGQTFNPALHPSSGGDQLYSSVVFPQIQSTGYGGPALQFDLSFPAYVTIASGLATLSGNSVFLPDAYAQTGAVRVSGAGSGSYSDLSFVTDGSPTVILRGQYGLITDFQNGRVILPAGTLSTTTTISSSYAIKDFNLYFTNQMADQMAFGTKPYLNSRFNRALSGMSPAHEMTTPAIFISDSRTTNSLKALGGLYDSTVTIRLDVWAETPGQLENALSLIRDSRDLCFPQITAAQWPLQPSGDYKSTPYNYETLFNSLYTPSNLYSVTRVRCFKGGDDTKIDQSVYLGRADVTLERTRRLR